MKATTLAFFRPDTGDCRVLTVPHASGRAQCILVVPGADVLAREIDASGVTLAQSQGAALATLSAELATAPDRSVCAVTHPGNGKQLALIASRQRISTWLDAARGAGLSPDIVLPDYAMLPAPLAGEANLVQRDDWIVRTLAGGFSCQPDLAQRLTSGLKLTEVDLEQSAIDSVRSGAIQDLPNLLAALPGRTRGEKSRMPVWAMSAAAVALVVASAAPWALAMRTNDATRSLRADSEAIARAALPDARKIVDPLAQLREAALPRQRAQDSISAATAILEGLVKSPGVSLSRLDMPEEGGARATLGAADLSQLQPLRDHISSLGLAISETPNESRPNSLLVELSVSKP